MAADKYKEDLDSMRQKRTIASALKSKKKSKKDLEPGEEEIEIEISEKEGLPSKEEFLKKLRKRGPGKAKKKSK